MLRKQPNLTFVSPWNQDDDTNRREKTKQWPLTIFIILAKLDLHELQKMRFHKFEYSTTRANGKNTASTRTREICLRVAIR